MAPSPATTDYFFCHHLAFSYNAPIVVFNSAVRTWGAAGGSQGATWNTGWNALEPSKGSYNWTPLDLVVAAIPAGKDIIWCLGQTAPWASASGLTNGVPLDNQDVADFMTAIVSRYKDRVRFWQVWNEWNASVFWDGTAAQMVDLAQAFYAAVKAADPNAVVIGPATTLAFTGPVDLNTYLSLGGGEYMDVVSFHTYLSSGDPNTPERMVDLVDAYFAVIDQYPVLSGKQVWSTEGGYGSNSNYTGADNRIAFCSRYWILLSATRLDRVFWYAWDSSWGTLFQSGAPTSTGIADQQTYLWIGSAVRECVQRYGTLYIVRLSRIGGYRGVIVWDTAGTSPYLPPAFTTQYRDLAGATTPYGGGPVDIGIKPMLFETGAP